jgi:DNA/RNA endonuclease YhcR with UshA esterase domain
MLQKEEKITIVLMIMALLVLIIAYFGFIAGDAAPSEYSDNSEIGDKIILQGEVVGKRGTFTGDHLILTVDADKGLTKVFIHRNKGAGQVNLSVNVADHVEIIGIVDEYEGDKEIIVDSPENIRILEKL